MAVQDLFALPRDPLVQIGLVGSLLILFLVVVFVGASIDPSKQSSGPWSIAVAYARFAYSCFLKPHSGDETGNQQDALESFYKTQAHVYDTTRARLLYGRADMLCLAASQLKNTNFAGRKPIWVDIGGGTGWNIERMSNYISVPEFFRAVYVVDLSPSLCDVARARFQRLGWKNVKVVCQDARSFRLEEHELGGDRTPALVVKEKDTYELNSAEEIGADLITLSFALSMIPEFYPVIDSLEVLLGPQGIIGVCDFYVQSQVDFRSKNYGGGVIDRHCNWWSRTFWRTWFEIDRVNLDGARRDYLEYRFGTKLTVNARNHFLGVQIPYYVWIGCSKTGPSMEDIVNEMDAAATESPFLAALDLQSKALTRTEVVEARSKAYECAIVNLSAKLPLPCFWYQNHHWRIYYDHRLQKHTQFHDEYIYAFTWEDSRVDARILKVTNDDVILAITSAGDNILSYALERPKRIHAVDLNPSQNHLLELKVAAFTALGYSDVWKLFGEGRHEDFREILISKLSPHMSSYAFQYWLQNGPRVFGKSGLYYSGGSRHAIQLAAILFRVFGLREEVQRMCEAQTLAEQREIWHRKIRGVLLSKLLSWAIVQNESWLWKALGVPPNQRNVIMRDYEAQCDAAGEPRRKFGRAIWEYVVNTLDPAVESTLLSDDNHYYHLCLQGQYSRRSHADYLQPSAHVKLSNPKAFDGLRIHTDEINEVIDRMAPATLTIAVVMDSMDWFDPGSLAAQKQIRALNRALKMKGRVMLRSAGLEPWYLKMFQECGFSIKCHGSRAPGVCIDRVNMYASCWICTKVKENSHTSMVDLNI